ncbi:MAG: hypothetical protein A2Z64_12705, partial [Betaproteobacteria bacterium RIFCSPLOWO2_02_67_12]
MAEERLKSWEALFAQALEILDSAQRAGARTAGWSFGGGTALMRRHRHRISKDIDIFIPDPQLLAYLSPRLSAVAASLTSDYVEQGNFLKLFLPQGEIDFVVAGSLTAAPVVTEWIGGRDVLVETSAEIIAKKVWHRGAAFTARDVFDFALVAEREPGAIRLVQHILAARREVLLHRLRGNAEALREDFAALDVLEFRPSFESCVEAIRYALEQSTRPPPYRIEQARARYRKTGENRGQTTFFVVTEVPKRKTWKTGDRPRFSLLRNFRKEKRG